MKPYMTVEGVGGYFTPVKIAPPHQHRQILTMFIETRYEKLFPLHSNSGYIVPPSQGVHSNLGCSSPAKVDTLTQATVYPYHQAKGNTWTQATLSHQVKVYILNPG